MTSIVVPAYNEERTLARLLSTLSSGAEAGEFEIIVAANGCWDDTVGVAAQFGAKVLDLPVASKWEALQAGNQAATSYPRLLVDADVELSAADVRELLAVLDCTGVLAAVPMRFVPRDGVPPAVGWYYDLWERLPHVRNGLYGRGVIALSETGYDRISRLPRFMSDDLAIASSFAPHERAVVSTARVVVHPPRTYRDLLRRRVRATIGNQQVARWGAVTREHTSLGDLLRVVSSEPRLARGLPVFLIAAVVARVRARRAVRVGDFKTWLRDESSRIAVTR